MKDVFVNLLSMHPQNLVPEVNYLAALLWLMVVGCALSSIKSQKVGILVKLFWCVVVIVLPLAGLFAYCLYALTKIEMAMFAALANNSNKAKPEVAVGRAGNNVTPRADAQETRVTRAKALAARKIIPVRESVPNNPSDSQ